MLLASADQADVFAANRARGHVALAVASTHGATRRERVAEQGSLRVRFPGPTPRALDAVIVNTAGGVAGGDHLEVDVRVGADAHLAVTTAAAEKIYRSLGPEAVVDLALTVGTHGTLLWLPRETI